MKVLAFDPGYGRLGVAVAEKDTHNKEVLLYSDCIETNPKDEFIDRLKEIGDEVSRLIRTYSPDYVAVENLFFNTNQKTAMQVAEARGAILYLAAASGVLVCEYTPLQVKIAITGYGRSDKRQMIDMIHKLVTVDKEVRYDDEYDAIGVALTCLASNKMAQ